MDIRIFIFLLFLLPLQACGLANSPTYGTGKTQESLLFETLTSIPLLTSGGDEDVINYTSRPTLVSPPDVAELPLPLVEEVSDESFPIDPETQRAAIIDIIKAAEDSDKPLPENIQAIRKAELERAKQRSRGQAEQQNIVGDQLVGDQLAGGAVEEKPRKSFWQRLRESFSNDKEDENQPLIIDANDPEQVAAIQAPERTSLSEPPRKYRTPEPTAPIGDLGTPEIDLEKAKADQAKKDEGSIFDIFKRKNKDDDTSADDTSAEDESETTSGDDTNDVEESSDDDTSADVTSQITGKKVNGLY